MSSPPAPPPRLLHALGEAVAGPDGEDPATLALLLAALGARAQVGTGPLGSGAVLAVLEDLAVEGPAPPPPARVDPLVLALSTPAAVRWGGAAAGDALEVAQACYEPVLGTLSRSRRMGRGVYFTPPELVQVLVRSAHEALREQLGEPAGLASPRVVAIDPALGTGAFLQGVLAAMPRGSPPPRMLGLELCPVALALARHGLRRGGERVVLRQVDALADDAIPAGLLRPGDLPVVLGNPPYRGHSRNRLAGRRLGTLLQDYFRVDGEPLGERNPKWLQDDYVKFFRLAQDLATRGDRGLVGLVTNHAFLDNPTFRGMRESLLRDLPHVVVLDLGGNRRRVRGTAARQDGNLFGIAQGVAATLWIRGGPGGRRCRVGVLTGSRPEKLARLASSRLTHLATTSVNPGPPGYELAVRDEALATAYRQGWCVTEIFPPGSVGVVTARDRLVTDPCREILLERLALLQDPDRSDREVRALCGGVRDTRAWSLGPARRQLQELEGVPPVVPYLYRPFQRRWACLHPALVERPRWQVMRHLAGEGGLALVTMRQVALDDVPYGHVLVSDCPVDNRVLYSNRGIATILPARQCDESGRMRWGLAPRFVQALGQTLERRVTQQQAFDYVYGLLHDTRYRRRFAECLARSFPRIHLPGTGAAYEPRRQVGERLRLLHLGRVQPRPCSADAPLASVGGHRPAEILARVPDPERIRAVLAEMAALGAELEAAPAPWPGG